jgi:hypothetical protein
LLRNRSVMRRSGALLAAAAGAAVVLAAAPAHADARPAVFGPHGTRVTATVGGVTSNARCKSVDGITCNIVVE